MEIYQLNVKDCNDDLLNSIKIGFIYYSNRMMMLPIFCYFLPPPKKKYIYYEKSFFMCFNFPFLLGIRVKKYFEILIHFNFFFFATYKNNGHSIYLSPILDPITWEKYAFQHPWDNPEAYKFPPFPLSATYSVW